MFKTLTQEWGFTTTLQQQEVSKHKGLRGLNYSHSTVVNTTVDAPKPFITRMEFIGGKFFYAVKVDTSEGFELCPADNCEINTNCPTTEIQKFEIINNFVMPNIKNYEDFLSANDISISGIEFILDKDGNAWTYDVNVNTNYNSSAELKANKFAYKEIANYLSALSKKL